MERKRTYGWGDPHGLAEASDGLTGLEYVRLLASERLGRTPMFATLACRFVAVDDGYVEFECELGEFMYNPIGSVHGGVAATLLDSAASCAINTTLPSSASYTTLDLSAQFLRPITSELGRIRAVGTVVNRGRRTALGKAEVRDASQRLLAHATTSCMLFPATA